MPFSDTRAHGRTKEREALTDTATRIGQAERTPTRAPFLPIGHIAIEAFPERNVQFSLPATTYWVKSLYISWCLHALSACQAVR